MYDAVDCPLIMLQGEPEVLTASLPEEYEYRFYRPEFAGAWCRMQCAARNFPSEEKAKIRLREEPDDLLARNLLFILDSEGQPVATGYLCSGLDLLRPMDQLRWIAIAPEYEDTGIQKYIVVRLMELFYSKRHANGIYTITNASALEEIRLFRAFGFSPYLGPDIRDSSAEAYAQDARKAWALVSSRMESSPAEQKTRQESPFMFRHEAMFLKCPYCKVYELSAPTQSGVPLHSHDYAQVWYVTRGICEHFVGGKRHQMRAGDAFIMPPYMTHSTVLKEGSSIICCEFYIRGLYPDNTSKQEEAYALTQNLSFLILFKENFHNAKPKMSLSDHGRRQVEQLMHAMLEEYNMGQAHFDEYLYLQIIQLLIVFEREYSLPAVQDDSETVYRKYRSMVLDTISYIDTHYAEPLTLDEVCRLSMISRTYFCYLFKMLTGKTFVEYLTDCRIDKAAELLLDTDLPVTAIGEKIGFHDSSGFSRTFKRLKGVSPSEYRNPARCSKTE